MSAPGFNSVLAFDSAVNATGRPIDLRQFNGFSVQVVTTGTGTATLTAETTNYNKTEFSGSDIVSVRPSSPATWTTNAALNTLLTKPADGTAGSLVFDVSDFRGAWLRFKLASASGTFTCKVYLHAKGQG